MRFLVVALAVLSAVWAQDPEGFPLATNSISSAVTPRTWASTATQRPPTIPSYTPPTISWTTITSEGTMYKVAVAPKTTAWTTITSGGGVWKIPILTSSPSSVPVATVAPTPIAEASAHSSHKTLTIVLSVVFSFLGAVLLLLAAMFFMRVRNQRRMHNNRSWAVRPGGWISEEKNAYQPDPESFTQPQIPAPVPSHTRQRSL
ncbi:hypothetical protein FRC08_006408 [Ceratobasidium sp. 394]|nr:hypothetical protein FRC08_006408 [Ceratobasidium sp. 394]KAG9084808.1 hypothetical protein FS749_004936 [Ceratobasidium sp. UAMH 11750]